ncbi:MAG TPA: hypothetical protein VGG74_09345 [Kofleriaceae bacterium]|jgi:hypothetical protein
MRSCIIVAALATLAGVAGCTSSSCTIPTDTPFTTEITVNESSADTCPAAVVAGLEGLTGSTMTFDSAESCSNVALALTFTNSSTSATCTATGAVEFGAFTNSGSGAGGSGDGSVDVTCSDGTTCTEAIAVSLTEMD